MHCNTCGLPYEVIATKQAMLIVLTHIILAKKRITFLDFPPYSHDLESRHFFL